MSEKMRAIAVTEIGKTEIIEVERPHAGPYEVVIKVKATSLCTVDQRNFLGIVDFGKPFIGGHEVTGEVVVVTTDVVVTTGVVTADLTLTVILASCPSGVLTVIVAKPSPSA